jgi:asparagine synthase (glutamine-hydrolysing)
VFQGIERLEAGHLLTYDGEVVRTRAYWTLEAGSPESLPAAELRELLRESVRKRLMSDVPVGVLLSGGIDSAAVLGLAREAGAERIDSFTIGFSDPLYDERALARAAATRHGSNHHEVVVEHDSFLDALPRLAWYRDEPISEPSEIPLLLLAEFASQRVKVVLGGDGGDELFGGYPKYRAERLLRGPLPAHLLGPVLAPFSRRRSHRRLLRAVETLSIRDEATRWASWFRSFSIEEVGRLAAPQLVDAAGSERLLGPLRQRLAPYARVDRGRAMLLGDFHTYLQDNMLARADKVLMAASLEGRVPLLDRELVERVTRVPLAERLSWRRGKTLLREAVSDLIPAELLSAPKRGFPVPVARLLTHDGGERLHRLLLSERTLSRGFLRPDAVRDLVEGQTSVTERELKLFTLLSLELWFRTNVDRVASAPPESLDELVGDEEAAAPRRRKPRPLGASSPTIR